MTATDAALERLAGVINDAERDQVLVGSGPHDLVDIELADLRHALSLIATLEAKCARLEGALKQASVELTEAANVLRERLPGLASIYVVAAHAAAAALEGEGT